MLLSFKPPPLTRMAGIGVGMRLGYNMVTLIYKHLQLPILNFSGTLPNKGMLLYSISMNWSDVMRFLILFIFLC